MAASNDITRFAELKARVLAKTDMRLYRSFDERDSRPFFVCDDEADVMASPSGMTLEELEHYCEESAKDKDGDDDGADESAEEPATVQPAEDLRARVEATEIAYDGGETESDETGGRLVVLYTAEGGASPDELIDSIHGSANCLMETIAMMGDVPDELDRLAQALCVLTDDLVAAAAVSPYSDIANAIRSAGYEPRRAGILVGGRHSLVSAVYGVTASMEKFCLDSLFCRPGRVGERSFADSAWMSGACTTLRLLAEQLDYACDVDSVLKQAIKKTIATSSRGGAQ